MRRPRRVQDHGHVGRSQHRGLNRDNQVIPGQFDARTPVVGRIAQPATRLKFTRYAWHSTEFADELCAAVSQPGPRRSATYVRQRTGRDW